MIMNLLVVHVLFLNFIYYVTGAGPEGKVINIFYIIYVNNRLKIHIIIQICIKNRKRTINVK